MPPPPDFTHGPVPPNLRPLAADDPPRVGPYRLAGRIGAGGMGAVYAAPDATGACVAVKVVHSQYVADAEFRTRFAREVDLATRVHGRCTARMLAADTAAELPWLATEYVPGPTLREQVRDKGPLFGATLLGLAAGAAEALRAVHAADVVHRDLKPGNVILAPDGPKVLDFGIARAVDETSITATGGLVGTPGWIAPELYRGAAPGPAADVFAWGGLVAFAATGRNPYGTGTPDILAFRVMDESPDLDGVPDALRPLVEAAMSTDPGRRPTAAELLTAVNSLWTGTPAASTAPEEATRVLDQLLTEEWDGGGPVTLASPPRRVSVPLVAVAGAVVLLLAAGAGYAAHDALAEQATPVPEATDGANEDGAAGETGEDGGTEGGSAEDATASGAGPDGEERPVATNGPYVTALDGDDTFVTAEDDQVFWVVQLLDAQPAGDGVEFTAVANYQGIRTGELAGDQFTVLAGDEEYPAEDRSLTNFIDPWQATTTVSFTVPGAPERGVLRFHGANYVEGQPGFPPLGMCYETGGAFSADTEGCG